jgi:D-alanyl-D-alanine carboxypeptidase
MTAPTPDDKPIADQYMASNDDPTSESRNSLRGRGNRGRGPDQKVKTVAVAATAEVSTPIAAYAEPAPSVDPVNTASLPSGWAVQVASSPKQSKPRLSLTRQATGRLRPGRCAGFTVAFEKDGETYYRARFGGFGSKTAAWKACNALKKKKIACYAIQQ